MSDNILTLLTPKALLVYLSDDMTIRQGLEKMRVHRYTAIPIVNEKTGEYVGSIAEGDLLYNIVKDEDVNVKKLENKKIIKLVRKKFMPAMKVDMSMDELIKLITIQNYVPIVDDRNILMGIVTRSSVMKYLVEKLDGTSNK
ncbi:MAG: CBS domain-containing protein [Erysipelotrichaceae bacterium]|nr:CBS domain-containing protein [Erysipelotrichaceae bacterium]